jgi:hypothetical protein
VSDPWADPATRTHPGSPYAGPPATAPVQPVPYGYPAPSGYPAPYGYPAPWPGPPHRGPARPGQVVTAAVLAFVQAGLVLIASLYVWFFASIIEFAATEGSPVYSPGAVDALATEGTVLAVVQLASAALLIAAGIRALSARTRAAWLLLVAATALQVLLALYWVVRLGMLLDGAADAGARGAFLAFTVFFAAAPLVSLGLLLIGAGRRWFDGLQPA